MKKILLVICGMFILFGTANATLITIGTATYDDETGSAEYNLIWDDDDGLVWLDYSRRRDFWSGDFRMEDEYGSYGSGQNAWASSLNESGALTYNIFSTYTVNWGTNSWRLPAIVDGVNEYGYDGTTTYGWNITSSEMGHLYYEELGNLAIYDTSGTGPQSGWGLQNTGEFNNLIASWYWSGTEHADHWNCVTHTHNMERVWLFNMDGGSIGSNGTSGYSYGIAVRNGEVAIAPVPEPTTILLFGLGILGLAGGSRRKQ